MRSYRGRFLALVAISSIAAIGVLFMGPIPQDPAYHLFADSRRMEGMPNFWNVLSNLPFLLAGVWGLLRYPRLTHKESTEAYLVMCVGFLLVGAGSSYYHLAPSNSSLLWDRLPMTVAFMAVLSLLLSERLSLAHPRAVLWLLVSAGAASALYWAWTESVGKGDLRPYVLVQFLPVVLIPLMLVMFPRRYLSTMLLLWAFVFYIAAKVLEHFDPQIFHVTGVMAGHAIKHVAAAASALCLIHAVPASRAVVHRSFDRTE
ncbi:MAG TPA: ceramidase domain-containing protein [Lysobacter sp.]